MAFTNTHNESSVILSCAFVKTQFFKTFYIEKLSVRDAMGEKRSNVLQRKGKCSDVCMKCLTHSVY